MWALDVLGIVDVSPYYVWIDNTANVYEILTWPIDYVKETALEFTGSENFVPSNEGFLLYFQFILYPILYIIFNNFCLVWIFAMAVLIPLYMLAPKIFIDAKLSV